MAYSGSGCGGGSGSDNERKLSAGTDSMASGMSTAARGRRRASMQDALDHTKINASLYDQDVSISIATSIHRDIRGRGVQYFI